MVRYAPFDVRRCRGDAFVFDRVEERKVTRWMAEVDGAEPASGVCFATPAAQEVGLHVFFFGSCHSIHTICRCIFMADALVLTSLGY